MDFDLFLKMVMGYTRREDPEVEMKDAFSVFDSDKDGVINSEEMRSVFSSLGNRLTDSEVASLIREADIDGDGLVDYNGESVGRDRVSQIFKGISNEPAHEIMVLIT